MICNQNTKELFMREGRSVTKIRNDPTVLEDFRVYSDYPVSCPRKTNLREFLLAFLMPVTTPAKGDIPWRPNQ